MNEIRLSLLVFAKNCAFDIESTLAAISSSIAIANFKDSFEIILIDDNSTDETTLRALQSSSKHLKSFRIEEVSGINNAIFKGVDEASGEYILPVPGHNMFDSDSIARVISQLGSTSIVIGQRKELWRSRPIAKFIGSKLLLNAYRLFLYSEIKDVHGLILYRRSFVLELDRSLFGHGFHMYPLTVACKQQLSISHVPISVQLNHKKRKGRAKSENFPAPKAIWEVLKQFVSCMRVKYS